jgi:hypothetical protein
VEKFRFTQLSRLFRSVTTTALTRSATIWRVALLGATVFAAGETEHAWVSQPINKSPENRTNFSIHAEESTAAFIRHI